MTGQVRRRLSSLSEEITRARQELSILREQLAFQHEVLEETRVRMLVAETPLADRDFQIAADDHRRVERLAAEAERTVSELLGEQDRLLAALSAREAG
jgi:chromosome segregation ATPase